jgi:hypothetical protein
LRFDRGAINDYFHAERDGYISGPEGTRKEIDDSPAAGGAKGSRVFFL